MALPALHQAPRAYARAAGLLYLVVIVTGLFSQMFVQEALIAPGDAAQTLRNIAARSDLWALGSAAAVILAVVATLQLWIEYLLIRPVSRQGALLFLLVNIVSIAVESVSKVFLYVVGLAAEGRGLIASLAPGGAETIAATAFAVHHAAFHLALIFFGIACLVLGELIARSGFLPALIGRMMQLAGVAYLIACVAVMFFRPVAEVITPAILIVPFVAECTLCLWLLIRGVDPGRWHARLADQRRT
ncbi:DUF4386 domain-containing protein [Phenylobacterium sp.]|uniref:DUF4386 domain-containing protein n=1 Tax=Phenylobacterium sp. TaxID=1871053 RepID=UPI0035AD9BA1